MSIFNSLGSNYELSVSWRAFFGWGSWGAATKLAKLLETRYNGQVTLVYKGREALYLALKAAKLPRDSSVAITGFTCFAVDKAVTSAGYSCTYLDISPEQLNFTADTLLAAVQANPAINAVIIQNTLGYTCDMQAIIQVCKEQGILIIEDLAHSAGALYADGSEAGTVGDFVMLSFGRDKIIDAVSGGALVVRNPNYQTKKPMHLPKPPLIPRLRDRWYPMLTFKIRFDYWISVGFGKALHTTYKKLGWLSRSVDGEYYKGHRLPGWYCALTLHRFAQLEANLAHRQRIARVYAQAIQHHVQFLELPSQTPQASNLRFPIKVENREGLIDYLAKRNIFISDTWYDSPIAPPRYLDQTAYQRGLCPESESLTEHILNLPTHRGVSEHDAAVIGDHINAWLHTK